MGKREANGQGSVFRSALCGLPGAAVFFGLLLLAAGLGDKCGAIMDWRVPISKGCLLLSAFVCALLAGQKAGQGRLLHALCAEGALLVVLALAAMALRSEASLTSIAVDVLLLLFGAFAGTMLSGKQRVKRKGKR